MQVDDAFIPFMYDVLVPPGTRRTGWRGRSRRSTRSTSRSRDCPPDKVRYHVCWGSWNGPHTNDVPLRDVLGLILQVNAGTILFENANPRHEHEWEGVEGRQPARRQDPRARRHQPRDQRRGAPGAGRGAPGAPRPRIVGPERIIGSTDCGFAQGPYLRRVHPTIQWAKLEALAEGSRIASRNLGLTAAAAR